MPSRSASRRTLWEEGRHPGRLVVGASTAALLGVVLASLLLGNRIGLVFDVAFVAVCVAAALSVRPSDFFTVGVMPPLLLAATVTILAFVDASAVARSGDAVPQAIVSGLAHHAIALVVGYGLTLAVLALRQVALRNGGRIRLSGQATPGRAPAAPSAGVKPSVAGPRVPEQPGPGRGRSSVTAADGARWP